jgi:hypothetical protein
MKDGIRVVGCFVIRNQARSYRILRKQPENISILIKDWDKQSDSDLKK